MKKLSFDSKNDNKQTYSALLCCSSFEERCLSIKKYLSPKDVQRVIIGYYLNSKPNVDRNRDALIEYFGRDKSIIVKLDHVDPILTSDNLYSGIINLVNLISNNNILMDITTFSHESLILLFHVLKYLKYNPTYFYSSAEEYSVGKENENKWLSSGVLKIRSILGFPGEIIPSRRTHLMILVGFEVDRAVRLIDEIEPAYISLGYGQSDESPHKIAEIYFNQLVSKFKSMPNDTINIFNFSCHDLHSCIKSIEIEINKVGDYNHIIAPMNNKISTLATAIFAYNNSNIQLCYAQPLFYNFDYYSKPSNYYYLFKE